VTDTIVETRINRKFTVYPWSGGVDIKAEDTANNESVFSVLNLEEAEKLGLALIGENATVITDLPEAKDDGYGYVKANSYDRSSNTDPESVLKNAKALLAIHKFLVEQQAVATKEAEVAKAKEAARDKRRDELATEFRGYVSTYRGSTSAFSGAIDRIIELEEAAK